MNGWKQVGNTCIGNGALTVGGSKISYLFKESGS